MLAQSSPAFSVRPGDAPPSAAGDFSAVTKKSAPRHVLVVDDEALVRWAVTEKVRALGYGVLEAEDAASTLRLLRERPGTADLILLDLRLPDCHDLELLRAVRSLAPSAVVILMTAFRTPDLQQQALRLGAHTVVDKPFDLDDLGRLLVRALAAGSPD